MKIEKKSDITRDLCLDDEVFFGDDKHIVGLFYLHIISKSNSKIFNDLGINKIEFAEDVIGYYEGGDFPNCKNSGDLTKLVKALYDEWDKKNSDMIVKIPQESEVDSTNQPTKTITKKRRKLADVEKEYLEQIKELKTLKYKIEEGYEEKVNELEEEVNKLEEEMNELKEEKKSLKELLAPINKTKTIKSEWGDVIISDINKKKLHLSYDKNMPLLLEGPSGTGKSTIVRKLAELYKNEVVEFNINGDTNVEHLLGHKILIGGDMKFEDGALTDAVRNGKVFIAHEINACNPEVQFILNGLLERNSNGTLGKLSVQGNNGEVITPHPNFRFFGTYNKGYLGTKSFGTSIMSRFIGIRIDPLNTEQEEILLQKKYPEIQSHFIRLLIKLENNLRNKADFKYDISTRDIEQALIFIDGGFDMRDAVEATINQSLQIDLEKVILEKELNSLLNKLGI